MEFRKLFILRLTQTRRRLDMLAPSLLLFSGLHHGTLLLAESFPTSNQNPILHHRLRPKRPENFTTPQGHS